MTTSSARKARRGVASQAGPGDRASTPCPRNGEARSCSRARVRRQSAGVCTLGTVAVAVGVNAVPGTLCLVLMPAVGISVPAIATLLGCLATAVAAALCRAPARPTYPHNPGSRTSRATFAAAPTDRPNAQPGPRQSWPPYDDALHLVAVDDSLICEVVDALRPPVRDLRVAARGLRHRHTDLRDVHLATIQSATQTLTDLVEELFALSRPSAGLPSPSSACRAGASEAWYAWTALGGGSGPVSPRGAASGTVGAGS